MTYQLNIVNTLRSGTSLEQIKKDFGIISRRHTIHPNLVLLKYDQIESDFSLEIVRECRGLILDETNDWSVVSHSFSKFFNYGEIHAAKIDWNTASIFNKYDGSLIVAYHYKRNWEIQSSGSPDAGGNVNLTAETFKEYFLRVAKKQMAIDSLADLSLNTDYCYYFELCGPLNRIVVNHRNEFIVSLGARNIKTGQEIQLGEISGLFPNTPVAKSFSFSSQEEVLNSLSNLPPLEQEGYVICDKLFNRIKVKSPAYLVLHHMRDGLGIKSFVEISRSGETSEVETAFPEFLPQLEDARNRVQAFILELESDFEKIKHLSSQKEFALLACGSKCSSALFSLRANKVDSIKKFVGEMRIENLIFLLGYKKETAPFYTDK